jgi:hypothetical protein
MFGEIARSLQMAKEKTARAIDTAADSPAEASQPKFVYADREEALAAAREVMNTHEKVLAALAK